MQILFYAALVVSIGTIFIVAIKGFIELMTPIWASKRDAQKNEAKK